MAGDLNSPTSRMTLPCVPNYSESLKLPNCMLGLPIGFTGGLNHTSKGTVTFPLRAPHGEYPKKQPVRPYSCGVRPMPLRMAGRRGFLTLSPLGWRSIVVTVREGGRARGCQNLWHPYLWNRLTDFLRSKFCGIVLPCSCALLWSYAHLPHMVLPIGQKLVKYAANWVQTLWHAYLWNCWMDLAHLKFRGLVDTCSCTRA